MILFDYKQTSNNMDQTFYISSSMMHTFLKYVEHMHFRDQKVLLLIDNLEKGLSEEEKLQKQGQTDKLKFRVCKNIKTCYCIMLHVQCLMDISDDCQQYANFINNWNQQYQCKV